MDDAIQAMRLSNRLMGIEMGVYRDNGRPYSASTVAHWRHPRARWSMKMQAHHLEEVGKVLDAWLSHEARSSHVRFQMSVNSPWRCWIELECGCGHWARLDLRRRDWSRCSKCRKGR